MANKLKVAWFDGLNIGQTHFEQQERFFNRNIDLKTINIYSNLYGIIDLEFSQEMLLQGKIINPIFAHTFQDKVTAIELDIKVLLSLNIIN